MNSYSFNIRENEGRCYLGTVDLVSKLDERATVKRLQEYVLARFGRSVTVHPVINA